MRSLPATLARRNSASTPKLPGETIEDEVCTRHEARAPRQVARYASRQTSGALQLETAHPSSMHASDERGLTRSVIRTPDQRLRVFVSSTLQELAAEREAAARAIRHLRLAPVMFELGARP